MVKLLSIKTIVALSFCLFAACQHEVEKKQIGKFSYQGYEYQLVSVMSGAVADDVILVQKGDSTIRIIRGYSEIKAFHCTDSLLTLSIENKNAAKENIIINLNKP